MGKDCCDCGNFNPFVEGCCDAPNRYEGFADKCLYFNKALWIPTKNRKPKCSPLMIKSVKQEEK
jgi:hypothetical protein